MIAIVTCYIFLFFISQSDVYYIQCPVLHPCIRGETVRSTQEFIMHFVKNTQSVLLDRQLWEARCFSYLPPPSVIAQLLLINKWSQLGSFCMYRCCVHVMNSSSDSFTMPSRLLDRGPAARGRSNLGYCIGNTEGALESGAVVMTTTASCQPPTGMTSVTHTQNAHYITSVAQNRKELTVILSCWSGEMGRGEGEGLMIRKFLCSVWFRTYACSAQPGRETCSLTTWPHCPSNIGIGEKWLLSFKSLIPVTSLSQTQSTHWKKQGDTQGFLLFKKRKD